MVFTNVPAANGCQSEVGVVDRDTSLQCFVLICDLVLSRLIRHLIVRASPSP